MKQILITCAIILVVWAIGTLLVTSGNTSMLDLYNWLAHTFQSIG